MSAATMVEDPAVRATLIEGNLDAHGITDGISTPVEWKTPFAWYVLIGITSLLAGWGLVSLAYLVYKGTGIWGLNIPVGWGWAIVNFVWWIGIGHAGTLISAVLHLFRQKWRTGINRSAEAMTLFAVACAMIFPTFHVGRVWVIYWPMPYPNQMGLWPNFRSPLLWDVFAISTYGTVSLLFWYMGCIPDLATIRDRAKTKLRRFFYGLFSLGWTGSNRHWRHYERAYLILAGLSTPLVLSVHSIVSFDFAVSILPGWHTTIFPPYFVAGAIFSGFAMVLTLMIPVRSWFKLQNFITLNHVDSMAKIILATGMIVGYAYSMEFFIAWYSGNEYERYAFINRATGQYGWAYWWMVSCNVISPQVFWFRSMRRNLYVVFIMSIFVNIGMWFERFVIVMTTANDFLPSSWDYYSPTRWDVGLYVGTLGIFSTLFLLFLRFVPAIAIAEVKAINPGAQPAHHGPDGDHDAHGDHGKAGAHGHATAHAH